MSGCERKGLDGKVCGAAPVRTVAGETRCAAHAPPAKTNDCGACGSSTTPLGPLDRCTNRKCAIRWDRGVSPRG